VLYSFFLDDLREDFNVNDAKEKWYKMTSVDRMKYVVLAQQDEERYFREKCSEKVTDISIEEEEEKKEEEKKEEDKEEIFNL